MTTVRKINEALAYGRRSAYADVKGTDVRVRIIRARTRKGILEGRALTNGIWYPITNVEVLR